MVNSIEKVSVVIPSIRPQLISDLEKALDNQTYPIHEVIVSIDPERNGCAWARNRGVEKATGDWVALIDDDCLPQNDWIEVLLKTCLQFEAEVAGGSVEETDPLLKDIRSKKNYPKIPVVDQKGLISVGCNIIFSKACVESCVNTFGHFYDESFAVGGEDHELSWRLRNIGVKFIFVPSFIIHLKKMDFKSFVKLNFSRGASIALLHNLVLTSDIQPIQHSMIWSAERKITIWDWIKAFFTHSLGPFDRKNFSSNRNFIIYWVGEKAKSLGFIVQKLGLTKLLP